MLLGYVRVSTAEQAADDRSSLENQEKIIRGFAMAKGFSQFDTSVYSDPGVSASIPLRQRPAGKELLETAKAGDTIIASKLDRMFRSASDALSMLEVFKAMEEGDQGKEHQPCAVRSRLRANQFIGHRAIFLYGDRRGGAA